MKNKGFMLFETLIVSAVILGALVFLFIQFSYVKRSYETSFKYDTIPGLYESKMLANYLSKNGLDKINSALASTTKGYVLINATTCVTYYDTNTQSYLCGQIVNEMDANQVLYVGNNISTLQNNLKNYRTSSTEVFSEGFRKFILKQDAFEISGKKRLLIEFRNHTYASVTI